MQLQDYTQENLSIIIPVGSNNTTPFCAEFTPLDDCTIESDEQLIVTISIIQSTSMETFTISGPLSVNVTIVDNQSK